MQIGIMKLFICCCGFFFFSFHDINCIFPRMLFSNVIFLLCLYEHVCGSYKEPRMLVQAMGLWQAIYLEEVYLVTALVPSETACLANSPGRRRRTAVWISREVMVDRLL